MRISWHEYVHRSLSLMLGTAERYIHQLRLSSHGILKDVRLRRVMKVKQACGISLSSEGTITHLVSLVNTRLLAKEVVFRGGEGVPSLLQPKRQKSLVFLNNK